MDMATAIVEQNPKDDETIEKVEMKKMGNAPDEKAGSLIYSSRINSFILELILSTRLRVQLRCKTRKKKKQSLKQFW